MTSAVKISMKINVWINLFPLVKVWILQCGYMYHLHQWLVNNLDCNLLFYCIFSVVTVHMHLNSTCAMSINTLLCDLWYMFVSAMFGRILEQMKTSTASWLFTDLLSNSPKRSPQFSPGYESTENMFYFLSIKVWSEIGCKPYCTFKILHIKFLKQQFNSNTYRNCKRMTCKCQKTMELGNSCVKQLQCIGKLLNTFVTLRFSLENNMTLSKTALRCILAFTTKSQFVWIKYCSKGSLVSSLTHILPSLPDYFSVIFNFFFWLAFVLTFGLGRGKYPLLDELFCFWNLKYIK